MFLRGKMLHGFSYFFDVFLDDKVLKRLILRLPVAYQDFQIARGDFLFVPVTTAVFQEIQRTVATNRVHKRLHLRSGIVFIRSLPAFGKGIGYNVFCHVWICNELPGVLVEDVSERAVILLKGLFGRQEFVTMVNHKMDGCSIPAEIYVRC